MGWTIRGTLNNFAAMATPWETGRPLGAVHGRWPSAQTRRAGAVFASFHIIEKIVPHRSPQ
jgi:hypothetical protein